MARPANALIDLDALRANYALACSLAPGSRTLAVIKANAYGHGALACARALEPLVPAFAVCCVEEALELRAGGIRKPVLLLRGSLTPAEVREASDQGFWLMVYEQDHLAALEAARPARPVKTWLKVDTGMHRIGIDPARFGGAYERLLACDAVADGVVVATHFSCADDPDDDFTHRQIERLRAVAEPHGAPLSMANSAAVLAWPGAHAEWNRPGIMLYGGSPLRDGAATGVALRPVMHLVSKVIGLRRIGPGEAVGYTRNWQARRESLIATAAIGYADGYPRHAPNGTPVLVNGQRAPLVGRVSMDMITVDVTELDPPALGDPVTLWGPGLPVDEVARAAGTISYELLTRMPGRAALRYS